MTKMMMKTAKGIIAGVVVGTAVSAVALCTMKPKPAKKMRRKAADALDTVGNIMQNIADYTR